MTARRSGDAGVAESLPPVDLPYDEMTTASGGVREHYVALHERVATLASADMAERQRTLANTNQMSSIYTPQLVRNGRDWPQWRGSQRTQAP